MSKLSLLFFCATFFASVARVQSRAASLTIGMKSYLLILQDSHFYYARVFKCDTVFKARTCGEMIWNEQVRQALVKNVEMCTYFMNVWNVSENAEQSKVRSRGIRPNDICSFNGDVITCSGSPSFYLNFREDIYVELEASENVQFQEQSNATSSVREALPKMVAKVKQPTDNTKEKKVLIEQLIQLGYSSNKSFLLSLMVSAILGIPVGWYLSKKFNRKRKQPAAMTRKRRFEKTKSAHGYKKGRNDLVQKFAQPATSEKGKSTFEKQSASAILQEYTFGKSDFEEKPQKKAVILKCVNCTVCSKTAPASKNACFCNVCKKIRVESGEKFLGRFYCSRECQQSDWPHKN